MAELLVLFACINNAGCSETSSQYYVQNPEFREIVTRNETRVREALGPIITQYAAPLAWAAAGKEATTRLSTSFYMTFKMDHQTLLFKREF